MAIAIDGSVTASGQGLSVTTKSWSHTVGSVSNEILIVLVANAKSPAQTVSSVVWDDGGANTALTQYGTKADATTFGRVDIWYLKSAASGTKTIKVTFSGSVDCACGSVSFSGVDQTSPFRAAATSDAQHIGGGSTPQPSLTITTVSGDMVVECVNDNTSSVASLTVGGGQTTIFNTLVNSGNALGGGGSYISATTTSTVVSWSTLPAGDDWSQIGGALVPASGAGVTLPPLLTVPAYQPVQTFYLPT